MDGWMGVSSPPSHFFPRVVYVVVSLSLSLSVTAFEEGLFSSEGWKSMDKSVIIQDRNLLISIVVICF